MAIKVPHKIIEYVAEYKLIKQFGFWLEVKAMYKNSCVYKPKQLYKAMDCSRTKINTNLKVWLSEGWCYYHKGNLMFISLKKFYENLYGYAPEHFTRIKNRDDIYLTITQNIINKKNFVKNIKHDYCSYNYKLAKKARKWMRKNGVDSERAFHVDDGVSVKILSDNFYLSKASCSKIIKGLALKKKICVTHRREYLGIFNPYSFEALKQTYKGIFIINNKMYRNNTNLLYNITMQVV